ITSVYQSVFGSKTKYAGLSYLGVDQPEIAQKYIRTRSLPNIGEWINFSSTQIANLCGITHKLSSIVSEPTESHTSWIMPIPNLELPMNEMANEINEESNKSGVMVTLSLFYSRLVKILNNKFYSLDQEFPHNKGWALKENLKLRNKARNLRAADRYLPKSVHSCLEKLAAEGELTLEEILIMKTIKGWIGRYSANFKKKALEKTLVKNM
ncbi:986_t:CDS:2, partial [Funneliformis geosporum]